MEKIVAVIVGCRSRPDLAARTCQAMEAQTVSTQVCLISVGRGKPFPRSMAHSIINLPLCQKNARLAGGLGMQLAFNEHADLVGLFHAGDEPRRDFLALMREEITRSGADIILIGGSKPDSINSVFITARAAFAALIWAQTSGRLEAHFCDILSDVASRLGVKVHYLHQVLGEGVGGKRVFNPASELLLEIYERTGFALRPLLPTSHTKTASVAVVTPYYKEPLAKLQRCHESVRAQGPNVRHFMVADGFPRRELDHRDLTHIVLPRAHSDNGNTPRSLGGMIAFGQRFDAVAYLDADNWFAENHIRSMVKAQKRRQAHVVCASRVIVFPDGAQLAGRDPEDHRRTHVDTSCFLITRDVSFLAALWGQMPQKLGPVCDRVFFAFARQVDPNITWTEKQTVYFETNYSLHYRMAGKPVCDPIHDIPKQLMKTIDLNEFSFRSGHRLEVVGRKPRLARALTPA